MRNWRQLTVCCVLLLTSMPVLAEVRAWLSRDRVGADETVTLNIETDQANAPAPDYSPLSGIFEVSGHTSSRRYESSKGVMRSQTLFAVALRPLRGGMLEIPALAVGKQRTEPLRLEVSPQAPEPARAGDTAFIETQADATSPYVQQAVGYTVRLYYAASLVSGQLDQDPPEGASLQKVGEDLQYQRDLGGKRYTVVERRFLLIPERSGTITIPGARFRGQAVGSMFDDLFGDGRRELAARGAPLAMQVRAIPPNAPQPWLPLRTLVLQYQTAPRSARVGEAAQVTVEARADGISATQMPELQFPAPEGAQVFADPPQIREGLENGRPQVRVLQRFSVVPSRPGRLRLDGLELPWWDAQAGAARVASLPELVLDVSLGAAGVGSSGAPPAAIADPVAAPQRWIRVPFVTDAVHPWALATVMFALLWLITLGWGLQRRSRGSAAASSAGPELGAHDATVSQDKSVGLREALKQGDLAQIASALCAAGASADLDAVRGRLADTQQAGAVTLLQQARWGVGDEDHALAQLRAAFERGPEWRKAERSEPALLAPLYPGRTSQPNSSGSGNGFGQTKSK